jgi:hypothetical protein
MKHTLALVLMVFGIVGCATSDPAFQIVDGIKIFNPLHPSYQRNIDKHYQDLEQPKAQAVAIRANGLVQTTAAGNTMTIMDGGAKYLNQKEVNSWVLKTCKEKFKLQCLVVYEGSQNVWNENQSAYQNTPIATEARQEKLARIKAKEETKKRVERYKAETEEKRKQAILTDLKQRCEEYGFTGESNISACIQREAQHDKELAMQKLELQRTYAQNLTQPVDEEEDIPFLIKFLGEIVVGAAEAYADPNRIMIENQQKQINNLQRQRLLEGINN